VHGKIVFAMKTVKQYCLEKWKYVGNWKYVAVYKILAIIIS